MVLEAGKSQNMALAWVFVLWQPMVEGRKARGKERGRVRRRGREIFITNK
jgi:hypothetical protein